MFGVSTTATHLAVFILWYLSITEGQKMPMVITYYEQKERGESFSEQVSSLAANATS